MVLALTALSPLFAAVTITDHQGVIYDIQSGTMNVTVSTDNKSLFATKEVDLVIPGQVVDVSTTAVTSEPYTVVGIANEAFLATAITSIEIQAPVTAIGPRTFKLCRNLTSVTLPTSVTTIGENVWEDCSALTSVAGLDNVTAIGNSAFLRCSSLPTVTFGNHLQTIGTSLFEDCKSLTAIEIPGSLKTVAYRTFLRCSGLTTVTLNEGTEVLERESFYDCTSLVCPAFPTSTQKICDCAFQNCQSLGVVTLPAGASLLSNAFRASGITSIVWPDEPLTLEKAVFQSVDKLQSVTLPAWLKVLPQNSFYEAKALTEIFTVDGNEEFGRDAFYHCQQLTDLHLSSTMHTIGRGAFVNCAQLKDVAFPPSMRLLDQDCFNGCLSFEHLVLPAGAEIKTQAFGSTSLSSITWPGQPMGAIERQPFGTGQPYTSMTIPAWMKDIPEGLCHGCQKLTSLTIEEGVENIGVQAFYDCHALPSLTFPSTLKLINSHAFYQSNALKEVTFNDGLEVIGPYAFNRSGVLSLSFPASVNALGINAFSEDNALTTVVFPDNSQLKLIPANCFNGDGALTSFILPDQLEEIGESAFYNCRTLVGPAFPQTLKKIGPTAFFNNQQYGPLTLFAGMEIANQAFRQAGVTSITFPEEPCKFGSFVFDQNPHISSITFPQWMTSIPEGFCRQWAKLTTISLGDNVERIGDEAFNSCPKLHDVNFQPSITYIGKKAFSTCNSTNPPFGVVTLYEGVEIADNAFEKATITELRFEGCADFQKDVFNQVTTIASITFPECMTEIPDGFCRSWRNLTEVNFPSTLEKIGKNAFQECSKLGVLDLSGCANLTFIGENAYNSSSIISITWPDQAIELGPNCFYMCKGLTSVTIPSTLNFIPSNCFSECTNLKEVIWEDRESHDTDLTISDHAFHNSGITALHLPSANITFGNYCFSLCKQLTEINFGDANITLGNNDFENCTALPAVSIPPSVTAIPNGCFDGCTALSSLDMGENVTQIGNTAFRYCALSSLEWSPEISTLGSNSFEKNPFVSLDIPGTIAVLPQYCFANCAELRTLTLNDGLLQIASRAFANCTKLEKVEIPGTCRKLEDCFRECSGLTEAIFNDGVEDIGNNSFYKTGLVHLVLPQSVKRLGDHSFRECLSLVDVVSNGVNITISNNAFYKDAALTTVTFNNHVNIIGNSAFEDCTSLSSVVYDPDDYITVLNDRSFKSTALVHFPYLRATNLRPGVFENCKDLLDITLPAEGSFTTQKTNANFGSLLKNCTSLQSIVWPSTGKNFYVSGEDISNAPLEALSYSYVRNIEMPTSVSKNQSIGNYEVKDGTPTDPSKSKLMVVRGEKWKYEEAGYGQVFDIEEMKDPQFNIQGGIYSTFDPDLNVNHYKASLRWDVPLSDLNQEGDTHVTIFRDDQKLAEVKFAKPELRHNVPGLLSTDVLAVDVTMKREGETEFKPTQFTGDFYFPVVKENGDTIYEMQYNVTESVMYFDAQTHKRQVAFDKYGYTSWFTFVDEFDSPAMDSGQVPLAYAYSAKMDAYDYTVPVNNPGYAVGDDGLRYHYEDRTTADMADGYEMMYTAMAMPTLSGNGIFDYEDVLADTDRHVAPTTTGNYKLTYAINPGLMRQKGLLQGREVVMYDQLQTYAYTDDDRRVQMGERSLNGLQHATGDVTVNAEYAFAPGRKYQTVVHSLFRGTFGSPTLTVPGIPRLTTSTTVANAPHFRKYFEEHFDYFTQQSHTTITVDVADMGYDSAAIPEGDWHLGLWRKVDLKPVPGWGSQRVVAGGSGDHQLLHHVDGPVENDDHTGCAECGADTGLDPVDTLADGSTMHYTDHFDIASPGSYTATYTPRLYVKIPSTMLPAQEGWMLAEAPASSDGILVAGLDEITDDTGIDPSLIRYYSIDGTRLLSPAPGTVCIRVTPYGAAKVRIP